MTGALSTFAGLVVFGESSVSRRREEALFGGAAMRGAAQHGQLRRTPHAVFAQRSRFHRARDGVLFAASSRLDNFAEIAANLSGGRPADEDESVCRIFETRGDAGIAQLLGAFAFAHWDEDTRTLTLARDCVGHRPLFYHVGDGFVAFASHLADLLALPEAPRELDERLLANFLALNHRETDATFYRHIQRVPSRSVVRITARGVTRRAYWSPDLQARAPFKRDADYIDRARELFETAVARTLRNTQRAAIHLSGGFDSSAVAAMGARLGGTDLTGYTALPPTDLGLAPRPGNYLDERSKVEALARRYPGLKTHFITPRGAHPRQSDPTRYFPSAPLALRGVGNVGWFAQIDDAISADKHCVLLHGGLGNATISWSGRFTVADLIREGRLGRAIIEARAIGGASGRHPLRVLMAEGVRPLLPEAIRRELARRRGQTLDSVSGFSLLREEVVNELDLARQWRDDGHDPTYSPGEARSAPLRAQMIFDGHQMSRDLAGLRFETDGVEARDPYADRELAQFCLTVPETMFSRGGETRRFARQVFAELLPEEILSETKRGEQASNWFESLDARKSVIEAEVGRIDSSRLASRLIDIPRLKRLIADWPKDLRDAQSRQNEYRYALDRAVHVSQFIRWVEGGNG